jgi:mono/diheme cytochrome c family protein
MISRLVLTAALLAASSGAALADGAATFLQNCIACHQKGGVGTPGLAPPLVSDTLKKAGAVQREYVPLVIVHGLSGQIKVKGKIYISAMPPRADFSDDDIAGLANYVLHDLNHLGADKFKPFVAADIAALRKTTVDHKALRDMRSKFGE